MTKKSSKVTSKRVHIISSKGGWAIKKQGASKASKVYPDKDSAMGSAQAMREKGHDVIVHKKDGTIQRWVKPKK